MRIALLPNNESERLAALARYDILDTVPEPAFDELTRLAAQICEAPIALITLIDAQRQWCKSSLGFPDREISRDVSFCAHAILQSDVFIVEDASHDERFSGNRLVKKPLEIRFYAAMPLTTPDGFNLGTLCLMDRAPRLLPAAKQETLRILGRQVMTQLELRRHLIELARRVEGHKRTEDALRTSETFYHTLVETLPQNIIRKDREGRFTFANQRFCALLNRSFAEIMGKTDFDFFPKHLAEKYHRDDLRVIETRQNLDTVEVNQTPEGQKLFVHVIKTPLYDSAGKVVGIQGIFWDVTERVKIEQDLAYERDLLRELLDNIPDNIYFKDTESRFVKVGKALARKFRLKDPAHAIGSTDFDFFTMEHAQAAYDDEQRIIRTGQPIIGKTEKETWQDGRETWVLTTKMPFRNKDGIVIGTFGISKDVTRLVLAERELAQARDVALESARLKSEFLANMSHEIRTPMNAITGMTGLLRDTPLTDEQREFVETIRTSTDALLTIINDILDFSKIEAGKLLFENIDFNLREAVEGSVELMAPRAQGKGLELINWIEEDLPVLVRGDPGRFRQVLINLIGNAVKFTEHGEVVVRMRKEKETATHATIQVSVTDTGIGISPKASPFIFQAFTQADGSTTRKYGGTGLGLAISKQLVELMCGQIGFESTPGKGSRFWFTLPLEKQSADASERRWFADTSLAGRRVLIVDDNATSREILQHQVTGWKMAGSSAESGPEALALLRREATSGKPYELVLLDMQMPEMDGVTIAQTIKSDPLLAATRLVLLTFIGHRLDHSALQENGIAASLVKPVKQSRLFDCLIDVLGEPTANAASAPQQRIASEYSTEMAIVPPPRNVRVLVAEDNIVNQKLISRQLQKLGYAADAVANGFEVLEALERVPYEIILMDCQMPEMDGYEVTRRIRQSETARRSFKAQPVYVIALTADALEGDRAKCLAAGMNDYLAKPLQLSTLYTALVRAMDELAPVPPQKRNGSDTAVLDRAILDGLRELREADEPDPVAELIDLFLHDAGPRLEKIKSAIAQHDKAALIAAAHALKGSASNLGARSLAALCAALEKKAKAGELGELPQLLERLQTEFERLRKSLLAEKEK